LNTRSLILLSFLLTAALTGISQNSTFSPYSRYGFGQLAQPTFAHNTGMAGTCIALRPDSSMPIFMNPGNPASYPLIRLTTLEVGGTFVYSQFKGNNNSSLTKWGTNFAYGALGFPIKGNGGACFGILPYSHVGYETQSTVNEPAIGNVQYKFSGTGGLNKAFLGYGIMPFNKRLAKFRGKHLHPHDSLEVLSKGQYRRRDAASKLLNDLSLGVNANYIFGNIAHSTRVVYPNSLTYNNTYRERDLTLGSFTGNFGVQTGFTIDSVKANSLGHRRALKQKVKFTFGFFMNLNNAMNAEYSTQAYNYILNGSGDEIVRDTVLHSVGQKGTIRLPLEQGFGIGVKKGERINLVADMAITDWQNYKYLGTPSDLKKNYRMSAGINFVPEKYAAGRNAFVRRINYRLGVSYQTGYISVNNSLVSSYFISTGVGLPVGIGRLSSMVNISAQYGVMSSDNPALISENYWRINFGFTFCDRWFQKFKYD
jgi:hypothetical protein